MSRSMTDRDDDFMGAQPMIRIAFPAWRLSLRARRQKGYKKLSQPELAKLFVGELSRGPALMAQMPNVGGTDEQRRLRQALYPEWA